MLEVMRKALKGWAGKLLIALFTVPFLFLGAESFFSVFNSQKGVINVNGTPISAQELANTVEANKERIRQRFGNDFDMSVFSEEALREGAEAQLIERELSKQYAEENNLTVAWKRISKTIREIPSFFGEDGSFSQEVFETVAAQQGISTKRIIEIVKEDMSSSQPRLGISSSSFALENEVRLNENLRNQKRDITYLLLALDEIMAGIDIADEEVQQYYDDNPTAFMSEETVRIEYLEIARSDFEEEIEVTDDELRAQFEQEQETLKQNARRKASHILVAIEGETSEQAAYDEIVRVKAELDSGMAFSELASKYSDDPGSAQSGGDLGFAARGAYVPEFEEALYALEPGQVSSPVLTEFGYHLIKLVEIEQVSKASFASEKERIREQLLVQRAQEEYQAMIQAVEEVVFETPDLDEAATRTGIPIEVSEFFTREQGEGIAAFDEVRKLTFSDVILLDKQNSSVVEVEPGLAIALRVNEHRPSTRKSFETVQEQITLTLKTAKAEEELLEKRDVLLQMLEADETLEAVAEKAGTSWKSVEALARRQGDVPAEIVSKAFEMPRPADAGRSVSSVALNNDRDLALLLLTKVHDDETSIDEKRLAALIMRDSMNSASESWSRYLGYMREQADIVFFSR